MSQADDEPYTLMGAVAFEVVSAANEEWVRSLFEHCELAVTSSDPDTAECAILGLLENVQNLSSHTDSPVSPEHFLPLLGPTSRRAWEGLDRLWRAVADDPPRSGEPVEYRHVGNVELRKVIQLMYRRLPDGRYVNLSSVLRWEAENGHGPHIRQLRGNRNGPK